MKRGTSNDHTSGIDMYGYQYLNENPMLIGGCLLLTKINRENNYL